ncbi:MAG: polysaccharide biosynthesis tyrosine autokinase [Gemmatimonadetes bacterium]|nr:polysaccharide biosynthesis tyrosine autokinase [Gemmatimonadota bacterium]
MNEIRPFEPSAPNGNPQGPGSAITPYGAGPQLDVHGEDEGSGISLDTYKRALKRHAGVVALFVGLGGLASVAVWRFVEPEFVARGSLWVDKSNQTEDIPNGPISSPAPLEERSWVDLIRSRAVLDSVVLSERLYLRTQTPESVATLTVDDDYRPGNYRLVLRGGQATLSAVGDSLRHVVPAGDSVGAPFGIRWAPQPGSLDGESTVDFSLVSLVDASRELGDLMITTTDLSNSFIWVELAGKDARKIASTVNSVMDRQVRLASELKQQMHEDQTAILEAQLAVAQEEMTQAEAELERFRIATITLPGDVSPVAPGLTITRDPVFNDFFERRLTVERLTSDRNRLATELAAMAESGVRIERLESIETAQLASELTLALGDLTTVRNDLRQLRLQYTDDYPPVQDLIQRVGLLETVTIPGMVRSLVDELDSRLSYLGSRLDLTESELSRIPSRTIEEARLQRRVTLAEELYSNLLRRYEQAQLAAATSGIPEVRVLDRATVPQVPLLDERLQFVLLALGGFAAAGVLMAIMMDRLDPRIRYASEVTSEVGLGILGVIPRVVTEGRGAEQSANATVEAFRDLRLNLSYAYGSAGPIALTVTSPDPSDGKSFIAANMAMAFAQFGRRTLVVDADTRRGDIHEALGVSRRPGLTDYLAGSASLDEIIQDTHQPGLQIIASGSRQNNSPELLGSEVTAKLLAEMRTRYQVIIFDSPPLGAGSDALLLGAMTGALAVVLRSNQTNKEMAIRKLEQLSRLPVRVLGAILNDVARTELERRHSYYLAGYATSEEDALVRTDSSIEEESPYELEHTR